MLINSGFLVELPALPNKCLTIIKIRILLRRNRFLVFIVV